MQIIASKYGVFGPTTTFLLKMFGYSLRLELRT